MRKPDATGRSTVCPTPANPRAGAPTRRSPTHDVPVSRLGMILALHFPKAPRGVARGSNPVAQRLIWTRYRAHAAHCDDDEHGLSVRYESPVSPRSPIPYARPATQESSLLDLGADLPPRVVRMECKLKLWSFTLGPSGDLPPSPITPMPRGVRHVSASIGLDADAGFPPPRIVLG
ncbi:hypothetical protein N7532_011662 [Penicillium argentinense]|uniref:Uncharacterized protein n=1 Tax=Penicillium argentinense TaxID=1131581 RepID=A0A9W9JUS3_9EURO|nr:uncharacterized protein N7532_011662 [Penicillium argentinense]KAJ5082619.1 hypothetical protein N7532_011662 [Penicillium argentinense]